MAIGCITVLPNLHEIIFVDIPLIIVGSDAGTGSDGAICHHGTYRHTCLTREKAAAHLTLVIAEKSLTTIIRTDETFFSRSFDKIKDPTKLLIRQSHIRIKGSTTHRENGEKSPTLNAF